MVIIRLKSLLIFSAFLILSSCSDKKNTSCLDNCDLISDLAGLPIDKNPVAIKDLKSTASIMDSGLWQVKLSWETAEIATKYTIKRGVKSGVYDDTYIDVKSPFIVSNLQPDSTQYFIVTSSATVNNTIVSIASKEFKVKIPLDIYNEKPGPFTMSAVAGDGEATLSWADSDRASFYVIQSGTNSGSYPDVVTRIAKSPFVDKNLSNGVNRYYIVIAVNSVGSTNASAEVSVTPLAAPGNFGAVTANPGDQSVTLSWGSSSGAIKYLVNRAIIQDGPFETIKEVLEGPFTDSGLINGTKYYYVISAVNANGLNVNAIQVSATPLPQPGSFNVNASAGNESVTLTWTNSTSAMSYNVQYGISQGSHPISLSNVTSPMIITELSTGTTYYFKVIAINTSGSLDSEEVSASPLNPSGALPPGNFAIDHNSSSSYDSSIDLYWEPSSGVESYSVYRKIDGSPNFTILAEGLTVENFWDDTVNNGTSYIYQIEAVNSTGSVMSSDTITLMPLGPPGNFAMDQVNSHAGDTQVYVAWVHSDGVEYYDIYRESSGSNITYVDSTTDDHYLDTGLDNGTSYTYSIDAVNSNGDVWSDDSITLVPAATGSIANGPPAPSYVTLSGGSYPGFWPLNQLISWDDVSHSQFVGSDDDTYNFDHYEIYISEDGTFVGSTTNTYFDNIGSWGDNRGWLSFHIKAIFIGSLGKIVIIDIDMDIDVFS